jgi:hypothetical protein
MIGGWKSGASLAVMAWALAGTVRGQEPLNPFGNTGNEREDAVPGVLEMSDGSVHAGQIYLTRDARLKLYDDAVKAQREVPLRAVKRIDCTVLREWDEKEWRFKENAADEKYFTGRTYPAREYAYKITLSNGKTIQGPLQAIVYVQKEGADEADRFLLHKRDKGDPGTTLKSLLYVRSIQLGVKTAEGGQPKAKGTAKGARTTKK